MSHRDRIFDLGRIRADPAQLTQVVFNLAINACEAMPGGGRLEIGTTNVELEQTRGSGKVSPIPVPSVCLYVKDSGRGMDETTCSHIFEPFFTTKGFGKQ